MYDTWKFVDYQTSANGNKSGLDADPSTSPSLSFADFTAPFGLAKASITLASIISVGLVATTVSSQLDSIFPGSNDRRSGVRQTSCLISSLDERMQGREIKLARLIASLLKSPRRLLESFRQYISRARTLADLIALTTINEVHAVNFLRHRVFLRCNLAVSSPECFSSSAYPSCFLGVGGVSPQVNVSRE